MATEIGFEEFFTRLIAVENRVDAISARFEGIQLYPLLRVRIFYALTQMLGIFDNPHPAQKKSTAPQTFEPIVDLGNFSKAPIVVLPFRRIVGASDPYSDRILEILGDPNNPLVKKPGKIRVLKFEPTEASAEPDLLRLKSYFAEKYLAAAEAKIQSKNFQKSAIRWKRIVAALEGEFGVELRKFRKYPPAGLSQALAETAGYEEFFKKTGTKHLFIVNAYSAPAIVLGAKKARVKVHEIQHGFITALHPAYSYPSANGKPVSVGHAPDNLLVWGDFWVDNVPLPKGTKAVVTGPTAAFKAYREKVQNQNRIIPKQVLFTSQGAVATQLLTSAINTAKTLKDHNVIYRLHPNETLEDYERMATEIAGKSLPKNFSFSHKDPIFLDLVSQSEYLVGAFSTTLYEGLALGCKVLVLPLPGFEHVKRAIALDDMTLVSSLEELPGQLATAKPAANPKRYYA